MSLGNLIVKMIGVQGNKQLILKHFASILPLFPRYFVGTSSLLLAVLK